MIAFVGAGRRMGSRAVESSDTGQTESLSHLARVYLTLCYAEGCDAANSTVEEIQESICRAYREGDSREKAAIISALPYLECSTDGQPYLNLALDCGRTNEADLFARIAIGSSFPSLYYSDKQFNQLVMKAAFSDFDLSGIAGLQERTNSELARMGMEYVDERLSAGRSFPVSLWFAIAPINPPGTCARMLGELQHSQAVRRRTAALALGQTSDLRVIDFLQERLAMENDSETQENIESSIAALQGDTNETI